MLGEVISTAGPDHIYYCDSYNFMSKFNSSSPMSSVFKPTLTHQQIYHLTSAMTVIMLHDMLLYSALFYSYYNLFSCLVIWGCSIDVVNLLFLITCG